MDERTLTALKASIKHWEENVAAVVPNEASTGPEECALCQEFNNSRDGCDGCPVAKHTEETLCDGSPYELADTALRKWQNGLGTREQWQSAAQAELDFLKSLLPVHEGEDD